MIMLFLHIDYANTKTRKTFFSDFASLELKGQGQKSK